MQRFVSPVSQVLLVLAVSAAIDGANAVAYTASGIALVIETFITAMLAIENAAE
jgi:hypothetical protein